MSVFGFDGAILACIDLQDGKRKWKRGRYCHGQLLVLSDQDLLLVLSEEGGLALVPAVPEQHFSRDIKKKIDPESPHLVKAAIRTSREARC